ncbi:polyribonucleotide nucleotidyltransferase [Ureibacillus sp. FSL K6-0165]|uniref:polyribonucleotide nucleotidyltransferase n=1 Tax=Ureibacillus sp. FSL K6-0165 TaxID=2954606 RepID=UPI0030F980DE
MDINSIISSQLASLQHTLQLSILDKSLNLGSSGVIEMLEKSNQEQHQINHPYKGNVIDVSI